MKRIDDEPTYVDPSKVVAVAAQPDDAWGNVRTLVLLDGQSPIMSSALADDIVAALFGPTKDGER